ncbi:MAG: ATP-binding cassette domain-containing protein [Phycisphaerae bacterium]|nr:ATP-binding cassette domain-containing protein [Phycisphaerae bacterium]MDD5380193.1 ATP-binding cassette domain-containing protein [Phycisphaerae bacterium]
MPNAIEIISFSYKYPDGTAALDNITLAVEHGQSLALIGPNGAGKSTLLLAMAGFVKGTGNVLIDGLQINRQNTKKIRALIGSCLEDPDDQLFMPTLFDDVAFGPLNMGLDAEEVKARVTDVLKTVGLADMADKAPHHLSAGQKRAAAIATVLAMSPKIITLDEPDGSLDPRNRNNLIKLLANLSQTLIITTANMDFAAAVAERVVLLDNGRIIADGPTQKIMSDPELMTTHGLEVPAKFGI